MEIAPNFDQDERADEPNLTDVKPEDAAPTDEGSKTVDSDHDFYVSSSVVEDDRSDGICSPAEKQEPEADSSQPEAEIQATPLSYPSLNGSEVAAVEKSDAMAPNGSPVVTVVTPGFDFWAPSNYKRTVKRVDDGAKLCDDIMKLVSERAEIEGLYASKLQGWSKKWTDLIEKGSEYATLKTSWKSITTEADGVAQVHTELQQKLLSQVHNSVSSWKAASYHKSLLSWKETKNAEEKFSKAQKPWAKKLDGVVKSKKAYHGACQARDSADKLLQQMSWKDVEDTATQDQHNKLKEKARKTTADAENACTKYKESLRDISNYNPKYKDDMCFVFDGLQDFEERRKIFFKQTLQDYCSLMTLNQYFDRFGEMYTSLSNSLSSADVKADLSWWAVNLGTETPIRWPEFEEYCPAAETESSALAQQSTTGSPAEKEKQKSSPQAKQKSSVCSAL